VIEADLFKFNPEIVRVNFEDNKIKQIGCGALEPLIRLERITFEGNVFYSRNAYNIDDANEMKLVLQEKTCNDTAIPRASALVQTCPEIIQTTTKAIDCELSQSFIDLKRKVYSLENELNKTAKALESTIKEFCERYNDHTNEKCKRFETTTIEAHPDDMTEGYIEAIID
jgi:hypothetical protein